MPKKLVIAGAAVVAALLIGVGAVGALLLTSGDSETFEISASKGSGKGYLGLTVSASPTQGLRVASVETDGPAAKAGIQAGDFIRAVDGQIVRTPEQLRSAVEAKAPGTQVSITYERADQELRASVKLGEEPTNAQIEATPAPNTQAAPQNRGGGNAAGRGQLGIQIENITPQLKQQYKLTRDSGIVITNVVAGSAAANAGLKPGDVILAVNGRTVSTAEELTRSIVSTAQGQQVSLQVLRGNDTMTISVQAGAASLFPGFENLPPALQERLQQLAQSGYTLEQLQRIAAGQNNLKVGTVKAIDASSITITPLETGNDVTFTLNSRTEYRFGANAASFSDIRAGSTVLIISTDGQSALGVFIYQR